jgi:malate dehydrogenase (oxaloacetate-decarboxylating)
VKPEHVIMTDSRGTLGTFRDDVKNSYKWDIAKETNPDNVDGRIKEAAKGSDIIIAASTPGPDVIKKEDIEGMAEDPIVFACANPVPEIWPWDAKAAGAKIVATGRSDFDNQINNSLVFPAIFRGALDVRAKTISDEMCIASASALAKYAENKGLREDYIIPTMEEWEIYPLQAVETGLKAIEQGLARNKLSRDELYNGAESIIKRTQNVVKMLMNQGFIASPPDS